jgi:hypothetical protein
LLLAEFIPLISIQLFPAKHNSIKEKYKRPSSSLQGTLRPFWGFQPSGDNASGDRNASTPAVRCAQEPVIRQRRGERVSISVILH